MDHLASSLEVAGCFESRVILKELAEQSCSQTMLETFTVNPHSTLAVEILEKIRVFNSDRLILRHGYRCLINLSVSSETREALAKDGALKTACGSIAGEEVPDDPSIVELALAFTGNLSHQKRENCENFLQGVNCQDYFRSLFVAMTRHKKYLTVQTRALHCLGNLFAILYNELQWDRNRFSQCVVCALRIYPENRLLGQYALVAIQNSLKYDHSDELKSIMVREGMVVSVRQVMWTFDTDPLIEQLGKWITLSLTLD